MYIKNLGTGTNIRKKPDGIYNRRKLDYTLGRQVGIEDTIDYMAEQGIIDLDDE